MLLKTLKISIPIILVMIIIAISYNSYQKAVVNTTSPLSIIPTNAAVILQLNDVEQVHNELNKTAIWKHLKNISLVDSVNTEIESFSSFYNTHYTLFKNPTLFISFHKVGANNNAILFSSNFLKKPAINSSENIIRLFGGAISELQYNNQSIFELHYKAKVLFMSFKDDIVFFSSNKMLVEDAIRASSSAEKLTTLPSFNAAYKTISKSANINLIYHYNKLFEYTNIFCKDPSNITDFSSWSATDLSLNDELLVANGFSTLNKNTSDFTDIFSKQAAQKIEITKIIPENTSLLLAIGFNNARNIYQKKNKILQNQNNFWSWDKHRKAIADCTNVNYNELINELEQEAGLFNTSATQSKHQEYTYFKSKNSITTSSLIQGLITDKRTYSGYAINTISDPKITAQLFGDLFNQNTPYFTSIDDYFIFSTTIASLEYLIDHYKSNNTLAQNKHFISYSNNFSSRSNLFFYINPGKTANTLKNKLEDHYSKKIVFNTESIAKFTALSLQITAKKDLLLNNINLFYDKDFKEAIKEEWFINLDTSISMYPQFVYNHFTKEQMIVIQNNDNLLFAINTNGKTLWSKQLNTKIIGEISVIDAYKNNKYQCLFNTTSQLHLIDRNGKYVEDFPKILPSNTAVGHALFDYNNTKKYRILIVGESNNIYNLDKEGKKVKGWKYAKNNKQVIQTPQHFRVGTKDYILAERSNSTTQLLAINGSKRITFNNSALFNNNPIQIDEEGTLYAITAEGKLWRGTLNGNSSSTILPGLTSKSKLLCSKIIHDKILSDPNSSNLIYCTNNKLYIVDASNFRSIYTFTLDSDIKLIKKAGEYVGVCTQNKLYLYNTYGLIEGFPVESDGYFNIADIDNNNKVNLINIKNGFIYNYELAD